MFDPLVCHSLVQPEVWSLVNARAKEDETKRSESRAKPQQRTIAPKTEGQLADNWRQEVYREEAKLVKRAMRTGFL